MEISVILNSRARPALLLNLLDSLVDKAESVSRFEVLVGIDNDDEATQNIFLNIDNRFNNYGFPKYFSCRRIRNTHVRLNELAKAAAGRYIFELNDDTKINTYGWDSLLVQTLDDYLSDKPDGIVYGRPYDNSLDKIGEYASFPVVSKKAVDVLGHMFHEKLLFWGGDVTLYKVFAQIDRVCDLSNIYVDHVMHSGEMQPDAIKDERVKEYQSMGLDLNAVVAQIQNFDVSDDVRKLQDYINEYK